MYEYTLVGADPLGATFCFIFSTLFPSLRELYMINEQDIDGDGDNGDKDACADDLISRLPSIDIKSYLSLFSNLVKHEIS